MGAHWIVGLGTKLAVWDCVVSRLVGLRNTCFVLDPPVQAGSPAPHAVTAERKTGQWENTIELPQ